MPKSPGQLAHEADVAARPTYPDGSLRRSWEQLESVIRDGWERNPTPRFRALSN